MNRTYVALDLETTGLDPEQDAILEVGAIRFRTSFENGTVQARVLDTWSSMINPGRPIPIQIQQLTGITHDEVARAPRFSQVLNPLHRFVGQQPVIGHNVSFDLSFLHSHDLALSNPSVDTFELASVLMPHVARYSLTKLGEAFELDNLGTHRALDDALAIKAYAQDISTAVIVGGGLLGLETARALRTAGLDVTVVEFFPYLLPRQLDTEGADVLQSLLEAQGMQVITSGETEAILGEGRADGIRLKDGRVVAGELILFSTGIRSKTALAQAAGLEVNRGVIVDEHLQTSAEDIFAAGDAAEFEGQVYGIIPAAIEQAKIAAASMVASGSATYTGTIPATTLKVAGAELTSMGESVAEGDEYTPLRRADMEAGRYRKFVLREGHIVGAILHHGKDVLLDAHGIAPVQFVQVPGPAQQPVQPQQHVVGIDLRRGYPQHNLSLVRADLLLAVDGVEQHCGQDFASIVNVTYPFNISGSGFHQGPVQDDQLVVEAGCVYIGRQQERDTVCPLTQDGCQQVKNATGVGIVRGRTVALEQHP